MPTGDPYLRFEVSLGCPGQGEIGTPENTMTVNHANTNWELEQPPRGKSLESDRVDRRTVRRGRRRVDMSVPVSETPLRIDGRLGRALQAAGGHAGLGEMFRLHLRPNSPRSRYRRAGAELRRVQASIDVFRRSPGECLVRSPFVDPDDEIRAEAAELDQSADQVDPREPFAFHGLIERFNHGELDDFAKCSDPMPDVPLAEERLPQPAANVVLCI